MQQAQDQERWRFTIRAWLLSNLVVIHFVYGLSFFTLGMVITLQPHRESRYRLARGLWALAVFAFLHAFADWGLVFIPLHMRPDYSPEAPVFWSSVLWGLRTVSSALSFGFLLDFGMTLISFRLPPRASAAARLIAPIITTVWTIAFFVYPLVNRTGGVGTWYLVSEVWARYLLALPAGLAAAAGLWGEREELLRYDLAAQVRSLDAAAAFIALYGLTGGLVVPPQSFWPASLINSEVFFRTFGVPVELVRALAAVGTAVFTARLMVIFRIETSRSLFRAEEERAIFRDRERIARDLHDGVLQTLYGVGLGLRSAEGQLPEDAHQLRSLLRDLSSQLGEAVTDLRQSILGLRETSLPLSDLVPAVRDCAQRFARMADVAISLEFEGLSEDEVGNHPVPARFQDHVLALVHEGLSNAVKHSRTSTVQLLLALQEDTMVLRIVDEGVGFDTSTQSLAEQGVPKHHGLRNMRSRTEQLGGVFRIDSTPEKGTKLMFHIPLPTEEPTEQSRGEES